MIRWTALIAASLSWVFAFHLYVTEDRLRQWVLLGTALVLGTIGVRAAADRVRLDRRYLWLLFPTAISLLFAAPAYRPGLLLFAVGLLLVVVLAVPRKSPISAPAEKDGSPREPTSPRQDAAPDKTRAGAPSGMLGPNVTDALRPVGLAALLIGTVLLVQGPAYWLYTTWSARNTDVPWVAPVVYAVLKWLGSDVSVSGGTVFVRAMRDVHAFTPSWGHLAAFPLLQIWLAGLLVIWWQRPRRPFFKTLTNFSWLIAGYAIVRCVLVILIFMTVMAFVKHDADVVHVEVLWLPWITALTLLPLIPLAARVVPWGTESAPAAPGANAWDGYGRRIAALSLACLSCLGAVVAAHFWDPGTPRQGRVLLDEAHSRWERSDREYDTDWYGNESGYNYYCMARYLEHFYELNINMTGALTPEKLAGTDVLILKTPTEAYAPEELDAIEAFVRAGGGLFALGEHTNVFGSSAFLNPVTRRFGMAFRYDGVFDIERKWEQVHLPSKLGGNPIMQRIPFYRFAVSCSIDSNSWRVRPIIRSGGMWTLPIEYAAANFYPHVEDTAYAKFGAFDQAVCATAGRGRVVAFGDSTVYSNFLAFYPGKPEFLLAAVDWLNHTNKWDRVNPLALLVGVVAALLVAACCRGLRPNFAYGVAVVGCASATAWLGMWACAVYARQTYTVPAPHTPVNEIVFEMQHSSYKLPLFSFTQSGDFGTSYEIFYQWVLRLGYYTTVTFNLDRALGESRPIVLIRPDKPFAPETVAAVRRYLEGGGALLVLESSLNEASTANQLLQPFDLSFGDGPGTGFAIVEPASGTQICTISAPREVRGGTPLLTTETGTPILAYASVGKGTLLVGGLAMRFADTKMGHSSRTVPNHDARAAFELAFALFRGLVQGDPTEQIQALGETYAPEPTEEQPATTPAT